MKVCFFGLGSIGKRHLINFYSVCKERNIDLIVHAFRSNNNILDEDIEKYVDKQIFDVENLHYDYDIVFITNPTSIHFDTIKYMINKTNHMFIEKPIFDKIDYNLNELCLRDNSIYYVACPLRYNNVVQYLYENIKNEKIYSIRVISSSYLPDWRPNIDYRDVYSSKKNLGGGVSIDLIHEWDYITYIFGFPEKIVNFQGKFSHLEIDSEDLSIYIAEYKDKLIEVHLDYFGRKPKREIEIYTSKGCIKGDLINNSIDFDYKEKIVFEYKDRNLYQKKELNDFLDMVVKNTKNINSIQNAYKVLKFIKESEK